MYSIDYLKDGGNVKVAQIDAYGGEEVLKTRDNVAKPQAGEGQVLVEVHAAGVNPFDWKVREGYMKDFMPMELPATLGGDVAGVVAEVGPGVSGFEVGQEVFGQAGAAGGQGSYAEFTPVKASQLALKPKNIDFITAAALPLASVSAYQGVVDHIGLQPGQKILLHGGAGGIGSYAIQIAKNIGAYVATTAKATEADFVKSLGADEVIDYTSQDFAEILKDYDAAFDIVGGDTNRKSYDILKPGGKLVSMIDEPDEELVSKHQIQYVRQNTEVTPERMAAIAKLVEDGKLKVNVDKVYPLDQAGEALEYLKSGHPKGKVVIQVK